MQNILLYGIETIALRYFNVFGPRQDPNSQYAAVIPKFISAYLNGESPTIYGDGEQSRDFTYVENVVQANLLACHEFTDAGRLTAENDAGQVFNIACGRRTTINELAERIKSLLESPVEFIYGPPREGEVQHSVADIQKASRKKKKVAFSFCVNHSANRAPCPLLKPIGLSVC